jgi:hypothetical protein
MEASITVAAAGGLRPPPRRIGGWDGYACAGAPHQGAALLQDVRPELHVAPVQGDLLYMSDPCTRAVPSADDNLSAYRGVFGWFMRSR